MKKMIASGLFGTDVNKLNKPDVPEMGGLASVLGFVLGISITIGLLKLLYSSDFSEVLVAICVICLASLIGLLDDISVLGRKEKAWFISFSSLPLIISQIGAPSIDLFLFRLDLSSSYLSYIFWLFLVPLGITGCANAINMLAGYNGLESGSIAIISFSMMLVSIINSTDEIIIYVFASLFGSSFCLYHYNKFPAKTFVGDIGTLGFGSTIAAVSIMSNQIIFAIICILPTFFELYATVKYYFKKIERRDFCMNPVILESGSLSVPKGADDFTLPYFILSKKSMSEKSLVNIILLCYLFCGLISLFLAALQI